MFTKTTVALCVALVLGLGGAAMANDNSGENHQDGGNSTGPNPYMTFSGVSSRGGASAAFAQHLVQPRAMHPHVKK
jgi:hypothetical protein